jgi:hypothetical protein
MSSLDLLGSLGAGTDANDDDDADDDDGQLARQVTLDPPTRGTRAAV